MKNKELQPLLQAMHAELARSMAHLKSPGHPKPYYISYLTRDVEMTQIVGRYGALCQRRYDRRRICYADVRVGSYQYDHVTRGGLHDNSDEADSYELTELPIEDGEDATRFCLWRLTDARYREAVRAYHDRKSRDVSYRDENRSNPAFVRLAPEKTSAKLQTWDVDEEAWAKYVRAASLVFKDYTAIKNSYVEFNTDLQTKVFISSEGTERVWQQPVFCLQAFMWLHTADSYLESSHVITTAALSELPPLPVFKKQLHEKVQRMLQIADGDQMTSYAGPVLMAPGPAGLFMHEVLGHRLEGSRLLSDEEGRTFKGKVGQRIMHEDISVSDNPLQQKFGDHSLVGYFPYDDEGSRAQSASLVENGVLKGFLTTRSPLHKGKHQGNGHARNQSFERPISRMGNLFIHSASLLSFDDLKQLLVQEIKRRKLPYGIILFDVEGGETGTESYNFQAFLGDITCAAKIYPNGREEFVHGVDFVGTPLASLANIMAVGSDMQVDNSFCVAESGSIPVSTVAPSLLIANLELQAKDPNKLVQHTLPLPWATKKRQRR